MFIIWTEEIENLKYFVYIYNDQIISILIYIQSVSDSHLIL
jgi:hypothetical protein